MKVAEWPIMPIVTRFAPSPTGHLHLGHAYSALTTAWRRARETGGRFLGLRIEDIDAGRCRPEFARAIADDLVWLGLDWDGPVREQSGRILPEYRAVPGWATGARPAVSVLLHACRHPAGRDRGVQPRRRMLPDGSVVYPGTCRMLSIAERTRRIDAGEKVVMHFGLTWAMRWPA